MKKIIALMLACIVILPLLASCGGDKNKFELPTRALSSDEVKKFGSYEYMVYDDGTVIITAYTGTESVLTVPDSIDGGRVVEIGMDCFIENTTITSVKLGSSLEIIGDYAFYDCTSLSSVTIGKKVWSVGVAAFEGTPWLESLTDEYVIVGDGVLLKYQGDATYLTIPENIKHLSYAFNMNYDLVGVEMGEALLTVGKYAFAYCEELRHVVFGPNTVLIDDGAFDSCTLLSNVNLPDSVVKIGSYAFNYCSNIAEIKLGANVNFIGEAAFRNCMRMKVMHMPSTVQSIGDSAFADCLALTLVFYGGTEQQFSEIYLSSTNYILKDVTKIYAN